MGIIMSYIDSERTVKSSNRAPGSMLTVYIFVFLMRRTNWAENSGSECQWKHKTKQNKKWNWEEELI